jgi:hypothetical protein
LEVDAMTDSLKWVTLGCVCIAALWVNSAYAEEAPAKPDQKNPKNARVASPGPKMPQEPPVADDTWTGKLSLGAIPHTAFIVAEKGKVLKLFAEGELKQRILALSERKAVAVIYGKLTKDKNGIVVVSIGAEEQAGGTTVKTLK